MAGPLTGIRIVEIGGIGPGPHAAMLLADLGAEVVRVTRRKGGFSVDMPGDILLRGRTVVAADLKDPDDVAQVLELIGHADVLIEGFRPGVMERMGLGPQQCAAVNERLVYGRMTGWGQEGPWADRPGHDLNYLSITGILAAIGSKEDPVVPLNLIGDFGGGSMFLVTGVLAALVERSVSGRGQVVDAAMVDGIGALAQMMWSFRGTGMWREQRASNILDGGAHFYGIYRCADGGHVAVGAIEPQFYAALVAGLGLDQESLPKQMDGRTWGELRTTFEAIFLQRTRDEWAKQFDGTDACVTPVLSMTEALEHPHLIERGTFGSIDGTDQPLAAPRFNRSVSELPTAPGSVQSEVLDVAARWAASGTR